MRQTGAPRTRPIRYHSAVAQPLGRMEGICDRCGTTGATNVSRKVETGRYAVGDAETVHFCEGCELWERRVAERSQHRWKLQCRNGNLCPVCEQFEGENRYEVSPDESPQRQHAERCSRCGCPGSFPVFCVRGGGKLEKNRFLCDPCESWERCRAERMNHANVGCGGLSVCAACEKFDVEEAKSRRLLYGEIASSGSPGLFPAKRLDYDRIIVGSAGAAAVILVAMVMIWLALGFL